MDTWDSNFFQSVNRSDGSVWSVIVSSVIGASHVRTGAPNQDSYSVRVSDMFGGVVAMAVADGHGSVKCLRSASGSKFASESFTEEISCLLTLSKDLPHKDFLRVIKSSIDDGSIVLNTIKRWQAKVGKDLVENPFIEELAGTEKINGEDFNSKHYIYGSTLIGVVVSESFVFFMQLGDGDVVVVDGRGEVFSPFEKDPVMLGTETYSICDKSAHLKTKTFFQRIEKHPPALVSISSDGLSTSFVESSGIKNFAKDVVAISDSKGFGDIRDNLPAWLQNATARGSGDDITVGLILNVSAIKGLSSSSDIKIKLKAKDDNLNEVGKAVKENAGQHSISDNSDTSSLLDDVKTHLSVMQKISGIMRKIIGG